MKKFLAIILILCMALALFACGGKETNNQPASDNAGQPGGEASPAQPGGGSSPAQSSGGTSPIQPSDATAAWEPEAAPSGGSTRDASSSSETSTKDTINFAIASGANSLDWRFMGGDDYIIAFMYAQPLWDVTRDGEIIWILATGFDEITPTQYVVHLREGVKFTNGNPFTAEDVIFSFDYCLHQSGQIRTPSVDFDRLKIIDEYTVEINLYDYDVAWLSGMFYIVMYDAESYNEDDFATHPVGTGPYMVADFIVNSYVSMVRNEEYWGGPAPVKYLNFTVLSEPAQRVNALQTGEIDWCLLQAQDVEYVDSLPGLKAETIIYHSNAAFNFNITEYSIMNNLDARLAVCYALNRQSIVDLVYNGLGIVTDWPLSMGTFDLEQRFLNMHPVYTHGYDPDLALEYAEKAGLVGQTLKILTAGSTTPAEILQANLAAIGVNLEIMNYDLASYFQIATDPEAFDLVYTSMVGAESHKAAHVLKQHVNYSALLTGYDWPGKEEYFELSGIVCTIPDDQERGDVIVRMLEILTDAVPWYGVCDYMIMVGINEDIQNFEFYSNDYYYINQWYWG